MNRFDKNRRLLWFALAGLIIIFGLIFSGIFRGLAKGAAFVSRPVFLSKLNLSQGFENFSSLWQSKKALTLQNKELEAKLEEYRLRLVYADFVATENAKLKELLGAGTPLTLSFLASVLAPPRVSFYDTLLVDLGTAEAFVGAKVFLPPNVLLGEIAEISGRLAKVKLYSTPGEVLEGKLSGSGTPVTITGRGGGNFKIILPREVEVILDEPVALAPDFLLGFVKKIDFDPREPEQEIYVGAPVNIFSLQYVFVQK
ncbi:MAG TPA: hypothetical protein VJ103_01495 [Candidatus Paceibacterota bacterium]|nr:hypothetical protein [Candidatus Paceibacterota bacterium]